MPERPAGILGRRRLMRDGSAVRGTRSGCQVCVTQHTVSQFQHHLRSGVHSDWLHRAATWMTNLLLLCSA